MQYEINDIQGELYVCTSTDINVEVPKQIQNNKIKQNITHLLFIIILINRYYCQSIILRVQEEKKRMQGGCCIVLILYSQLIPMMVYHFISLSYFYFFFRFTLPSFYLPTSVLFPPFFFRSILHVLFLPCCFSLYFSYPFLLATLLKKSTIFKLYYRHHFVSKFCCANISSV